MDDYSSFKYRGIAFLYDRILNTRDNESIGECPLWSGPNLNPFQEKIISEPTKSSIKGRNIENDLKYAISYENVNFIISSLSEILYEVYFSPFLTVHERVVCAVGVNEGPYLPLAVLSLHFLCLKFKNLIMVPIDLSEGKDRINFQFQDVGCNILLMRKNQANPPKLSDAKVPSSMVTIDIDDLIGESISFKAHRKSTSWKCSSIIALESSNIHFYTSHIVYTSGSTGRPKGCVCSMNSLLNYISAKNLTHGVTEDSVVLLASSLSFDPCLSDIIATFYTNGTLVLPRRDVLQSNMQEIIDEFGISHVLCTPSLWRVMPLNGRKPPSLKVIALGGESIPNRIISYWSRNGKNDNGPSLFSTYGVTEGKK